MVAVRSLAFLGWAEVPEASTETKYLCLFLPIVSLLEKHLRNFQLLN
jgi:hypothetical protein